MGSNTTNSIHPTVEVWLSMLITILLQVFCTILNGTKGSKNIFHKNKKRCRDGAMCL